MERLGALLKALHFDLQLRVHDLVDEIVNDAVTERTADAIAELDKIIACKKTIGDHLEAVCRQQGITLEHALLDSNIEYAVSARSILTGEPSELARRS